MEWPYTQMPAVTYGSSAANTLNVTVFYALTVISRSFMHLKCWKASGRFGAWTKHPGYPVKCTHCGRTISRRD